MKQILITGATGAVGSALVPLYLADPDTAVHLLIRARSQDHLEQRTDALLQFWGLPSGAASSLDLHVHAGDVCRPNLGLPETVYESLVDQLTHVVHCAGNVKLNQPLDAARRSAVDSARHVVTLARACQKRGSLEKLDVLSTVGVAGRTSGLVQEEPVEWPREFHNTYEAAKAEAESFLWDEIQAGLPATIHRPSMVVGDSQTGRIIHFQVFYYLSEFLTGRKTFGILPDMGRIQLDIIPADYVARAVHLSSGCAESIGRILHLCSGPDVSLELTELTDRLRQIHTARGESLPTLRRVPRAWLAASVKLLEKLSTGRTRRALQSLPFFLAYLEEEQSFDTTKTREFFSPRSLEVPQVEDYLQPVIQYYRTTKAAGEEGKSPRRSLEKRLGDNEAKLVGTKA